MSRSRRKRSQRYVGVHSASARMPNHQSLLCSSSLTATYLPAEHDDPHYTGGGGFGDGAGAPFPLRKENDASQTAWMDVSLAGGGGKNFWFDFGVNTIARTLRYTSNGRDWRARSDAEEIEGKGQWKIDNRGTFDRSAALDEVPRGAGLWQVHTSRGWVPIVANQSVLLQLEHDFCGGAGHLTYTSAYPGQWRPRARRSQSQDGEAALLARQRVTHVLRRVRAEDRPRRRDLHAAGRPVVHAGQAAPEPGAARVRGH